MDAWFQMSVHVLCYEAVELNFGVLWCRNNQSQRPRENQLGGLGGGTVATWTLLSTYAGQRRLAWVNQGLPRK